MLDRPHQAEIFLIPLVVDPDKFIEVDAQGILFVRIAVFLDLIHQFEHEHLLVHLRHPLAPGEFLFRAGEPQRLRLRLSSAAGRLARSGRRLRLRLAATWPRPAQLTAAITRPQAFAPG